MKKISSLSKKKYVAIMITTLLLIVFISLFLFTAQGLPLITENILGAVILSMTFLFSVCTALMLNVI